VARDEDDYLAHLRDLQSRWREPDQRTLSYPHGEISVSEYLRRWAADRPDHPAILFEECRLTFAELNDASDRLANFLRPRLQPGERVGIMLPNSPEYIVSFFAILRAGAVVVPINPMFTPYEMSYEISDSGVACVIAERSSAEFLSHLVETTNLRRFIYTDALGVPANLTGGGQGDPVPLEQPEGDAGATGWAAALALHDSAPGPGGESLDDFAVLNYTGGTTGLPKGCVHTQRDMIYTAACIASGQAINGPDEMSLVYIPVYWIAGEDYGILLPIFTGTTVVLLPRWDPSRVLSAIDTHRVTAMLGTVDNYLSLLQAPDFDTYDLSSLRTPLTMSFVTRLNAAIRAQWRSKTGGVLREAGLGITETNAVDAVTTGFQADDFDLNATPVFCGLAVPGTEMKVVDFDTREIVELGSPGELAIRSPSIFRAYWNRPDETARAFDNGWFLTGDIGLIDEEGLVHLLGRRKEMLKVNGMSVYPSEIEIVFLQHPDVLRCGVVGVPDPDRGERPVAFIEASSSQVEPAGLTAWVRERLSSYKVPEVRVVDALPLTTNGKVLKRALQETALASGPADGG
jgi:acyl-CoA synthetase (AMP-forming)/AMP-acid ligase II